MKLIGNQVTYHKWGREAGVAKANITKGKGTECPICRQRASNVIDSRRANNGQVRRRRECECGHRYTTFELVAVDMDYIPDYQI